MSTEEAGEAPDRAEAAAGYACDLYNQLAASLFALVEALQEKRRAGHPLTEAEIRVVREHQKAIMLVLGFEKDVLKKHGSVAAPRAALDLDAARAEIARRLDRLMRAGDA